MTLTLIRCNPSSRPSLMSPPEAAVPRWTVWAGCFLAVIVILPLAPSLSPMLTVPRLSPRYFATSLRQTIDLSPPGQFQASYHDLSRTASSHSLALVRRDLRDLVTAFHKVHAPSGPGQNKMAFSKSKPATYIRSPLPVSHSTSPASQMQSMSSQRRYRGKRDSPFRIVDTKPPITQRGAEGNAI